MRNTLQIQNLKCGGCANTIKKSINKIEGVSDVTVDNDESEISFSYSSEYQIELVINKLDFLGYPIFDSENSFMRKAMSYASCAVGKINNN